MEDSSNFIINYAKPSLRACIDNKEFTIQDMLDTFVERDILFILYVDRIIIIRYEKGVNYFTLP